MTCIEITGENAKEVVDMVVGIFGPRIVVPMEGRIDEPVRKMPEPEELPDAGNVQTKEGLGKASAENEAYKGHVEELVKRLYATGNSLRVLAEGEDFENFNSIADICYDAARILKIFDDSLGQHFQNSINAAIEIGKILAEEGESK